jgi:hypothetical protein
MATQAAVKKLRRPVVSLAQGCAMAREYRERIVREYRPRWEVGPKNNGSANP